ncbi:DUF3649 domain-containing protein [Teichococcus oryzae]|nr:DUF3649 domain-containing protein [Pseudoroseomonas oryzae]
MAAGIGGGYAVTALATMALSMMLPLPRAEAVLAATMASFALYAATIIWAFAARGLLRLCVGMAAAVMVLGLIVFLAQGHPA